MSLIEYNKKRNFKKTIEPQSACFTNTKNNIFVVQKHQASHLHYDFRLAIDGVLKSWAVPKGPSMNPKDKRLAVMTEDHPIEYAEFAGVIPEGEYGAGTVEIWDKGTWEPLNNVKLGLQQKKLEFILYGKKMTGIWVLVGFKNDPKNWLLIKKNESKHGKN
jgi:bifunctional non-homologous end joining protein LigD